MTQLERSLDGTEPGSHVVQFAAPYGATSPAPHCTHALSTGTQPGMHLTQAERSSDGTKPASHGAQSLSFVAPRGETRPGSHWVHSVAPSALHVPERQKKHSFPLRRWPAGHTKSGVVKYTVSLQCRPNVASLLATEHTTASCAVLGRSGDTDTFVE